MRSTNIIIKKELIDELKKFAKNVCIGAATYVREILTGTAYEAFERFYCDYTPKDGIINTNYQWKFHVPKGIPMQYVRTYNVLRNGVKKYYENKHGKIIRGGVELTPQDMDELYDISAAKVFDDIYLHGYHGVPIIKTNDSSGELVITKDNHGMYPTPEMIIDKKHRELSENPDKYMIYSINHAKQNSYSYLRW